MNNKLLGAALFGCLTLHATLPVCAQDPAKQDPNKKLSLAEAVGAESGANSQAFPTQILRTGVNITKVQVSPNSMQVADDVQLTPVLQRIQSLRARIESSGASPERSDARLDLMEAKQQAMLLLQRTNFEIDFAMAEIAAEQNIYNEILGRFTSDRDKLLARVNATSFITNGILWAVAEGLDIPTSRHPNFSTSSGTAGILAGVVPSIASMYTLKAVNGRKQTSEVEPNMLAKLFGYPVNQDIEYPVSVWRFLNQSPADEPKAATRRDQLVDRWVKDSNIPNFNNRDNKEQLDVLTASVAQKKGLSIATLSTRQVMLQQLSAEVLKMKRMLLELAMVVQGEKQLVASTALKNYSPLTVLPADAKNEFTNSGKDEHPYFTEIGARGLTAQAIDRMFEP
jgi:predicted GNAT family acetyltransferase